MNLLSCLLDSILTFIFAISALSKVFATRDFVDSLNQYGLNSERGRRFVGSSVIAIETGLAAGGGALLLWTNDTAWLLLYSFSALFIASLSMAVALASKNGPVNCNCFGKVRERRLASHLSQNAILMTATLILIVGGPPRVLSAGSLVVAVGLGFILSAAYVFGPYTVVALGIGSASRSVTP